MPGMPYCSPPGEAPPTYQCPCHSNAPLIVDARDILRDPEGMLTGVCTALGIPFDAAMLRWAPGPKACDGVWAKHWYESVWASTGFAAHEPRLGDLPDRLVAVLDEVQPIYTALAAARLR